MQECVLCLYILTDSPHRDNINHKRNALIQKHFVQVTKVSSVMNKSVWVSINCGVTLLDPQGRSWKQGEWQGHSEGLQIVGINALVTCLSTVCVPPVGLHMLEFRGAPHSCSSSP